MEKMTQACFERSCDSCIYIFFLEHLMIKNSMVVMNNMTF